MTPLIDAHGRVHSYLRIALDERCNLRCRYCMPVEGVPARPREEFLDDEEIVRLAHVFAGLGVRRIRLTGGEPLVRPGAAALVRRLAGVPGIDEVALTTNGTLLARHARALRAAGLARVNVSLDTLRAGRFARIARRDVLPDVHAGIDAALDAGFGPLRINVVVMRGVNDDELPDFVAFARARPIHVRFIEYMPFAANGWRRDGLVPAAEMRAAIARTAVLRPLPPEGPSDVARYYEVDGGAATIGFIASITEHFCDGCSRVRITADGAFKPCLFSPAETSLRDALRSGYRDDELAALVRAVLAGKPPRHPGIGRLDPSRNRSMIRIGG